MKLTCIEVAFCVSFSRLFTFFSQICKRHCEISPQRVIHAGFYATLAPIHANPCSQDDRCRDASCRKHPALQKH